MSSTGDLTGLGRIIVKDDRDHTFKMQIKRGMARSKLWSSPGVMDQGETSQCVAYSGIKYLTGGPVINKTPPWSPELLYKMAQAVDEWPGEDYDGTTVRALFKVLKREGYVEGYEWAEDFESVVAHLLEHGPVVMGTIWTIDMFTPDRWGYIQPTGEDQGGHAWLLVGADRDRKNPDKSKGAVRMINSWGRNWGTQGGRAWITFNHLDTLIKTDGEAAVSTEIRVKR